MACLPQLLWNLLQLAGISLLAGGVIRVLGYLGLFPIFEYIGYEVHQYPWNGQMRRTVNAKIQSRFSIWPTEIQAELKLARGGETIDEKNWLAWEDTMNPDKIKLPWRHTAWVRVLSVNEDDNSIGVPLSIGNGQVYFSHIPSGEYDVQLWVRCPSWSRNHRKKLLQTWHWRVPEDILAEPFKPYSSS
jgi:hypothetical protein